ncbi:MAG: NAD(P) transhydrogenase subunit alpha [Phycisphaerae bacterium]|nr:NAD(P) transhydrogenase subunit alpha [Phycisphaerae bacterium]
MVDVLLMLIIFVVAFAIGYVLISRVPQMLHTPLMSMTNAISAVTILGALLLFSVPTPGFEKALGAIAIVTAAFNLVGGFVITDRMLGMFRRKHAVVWKTSVESATTSPPPIESKE